MTFALLLDASELETKSSTEARLTSRLKVVIMKAENIASWSSGSLASDNFHNETAEVNTYIHTYMSVWMCVCVDVCSNTNQSVKVNMPSYTIFLRDAFISFENFYVKIANGKIGKQVLHNYKANLNKFYCERKICTGL